MKKISEFIDKNLGYILVVPAILFILAFSIIPIIQSTKYAFFDFQLNAQQKSGMYFSEHYNVDMNLETFEYIDFFLDLEKEETKEGRLGITIDTAKARIKNQQDLIMGEIRGNSGVVKITEEKIDKIRGYSDNVIKELDKVYSFDYEYSYKEDIYSVAEELETTIITSNYIGFENFATVFKDDRVRHALFVTLVFTVVSVGFELVLGLGLALIMNQAIRGKGLIRTLSLIPWAIPTSVAALIWAYMYNGSNGIVAVLLEKANIIGDSTDILLSGSGALAAVIFADVWKTTPYMALLLLAGLQVIPNSLYESSALDGANKIQQFFSITLPLLKPSILVALLFRTLDAFRVFDLIYVLTGGGPGGQTESISIYAYKTMFAQTRFGYGSAVVILMALVVGVISYVYIKLLDVKLTSE